MAFLPLFSTSCKATEIAPEIAQKFEVQGIPCLVVIKDGSEIGRIVGFNNESALKQKIDAIIGAK